MDDLKLATEEQLRKQYLEISRSIYEYQSQMPEEQWESPAKDYMFDDEVRRMRDIFFELQCRDLLTENEKKTGDLDDPEEDEEATSE